MGTLYIADKGVGFESDPVRHLYLIYDPDGSMSSGTYSGDEVVVRGGTSEDSTGLIELEESVLLTASRDGFSTIPSNYSTLRDVTLLASGSSADTDWTNILNFMQSITKDNISGNVYDSIFTYNALTDNSNSVINSALASAGINLSTHMPVLGSDLDGDGLNPMGQSTRLSQGNAPDSTVFISGSQGNEFFDTANNNNLFIDAAGTSGTSGNDKFFGGADGVEVNENTLVSCPGNTRTKSGNFAQNRIGGSGPDERPLRAVVMLDEGVDLFHQFLDASK